MKNLIIIFIMFLSVNSLAQEKKNICDKDSTSSNYDFEVMFLNGYGVGYNMDLSSSSRIRFLINLTSYSNSDEGETKSHSEHAEDSYIYSDNRKSENDYLGYDLYLSPQYLVNIYESKLGLIYFGGGPFISYSWNDSKSEYENNYDGGYNNSFSKGNSDYNSDYLNIGVMAVLGITGRINDAISLLAVIDMQGAKQWSNSDDSGKYSNDENNGINMYKMERDGWLFSLNRVKIGVKFTI